MVPTAALPCVGLGVLSPLITHLQSGPYGGCFNLILVCGVGDAGAAMKACGRVPTPGTAEQCGSLVPAFLESTFSTSLGASEGV